EILIIPHLLEDHAIEERIVFKNRLRRRGNRKPLVDKNEQRKLMRAHQVAFGAEVVPEIALRYAYFFGNLRSGYSVVTVLVEEPEARRKNPVLGLGCHALSLFSFRPCRRRTARPYAGFFVTAGAPLHKAVIFVLRQGAVDDREPRGSPLAR